MCERLELKTRESKSKQRNERAKDEDQNKNHISSKRRTTVPMSGLFSGSQSQQSTNSSHIESVKVVGK